ncbi:MAG TPA: phage tail tape measure protein [Actinokineospora sp.]|nr:phage tail tape measure protein [Actinokineospora sp.]
MAKPIKVTILGDVKDLIDKLTDGESGVAAFASKVGASAKDVAASAAGFVAAGVAAGGLGGALVESLDRGKILGAMEGALGATAQEAERYGQAAGSLYAKGYGDTFTDVTGTIEAVVSTLGKLDTPTLESATGKALDLAQAFQVDVQGAIASVGILLKTGMAKDANEAFDLITKGLQNVPAAVRGDFLEIADEYTVFFQALGFTGQEAFGVLATAAKGGKIQLDKAGDALKEFRIRSVDMSVTSVDAYKAIGLNAKDMAKAILGGGEGAKMAFQKILDGIVSIKDPIKRETAAVGLFGTQFEDLGNIDALAALRPMTNALTGVGGAADQLGKSLHDNASSNIDAFGRMLSTVFVDFIGGKVIPKINELVTYLQANFGPALDAVGAFVTGVVLPALGAMAKFLGDNAVEIGIVAGLIGAVLLPALIASGVTATIAGAKQAAAWFKAQLAASRSALAQVGAAGKTVASWVLMGARATVSAATTAAAWAMSAARTVASLTLTAASFIAQGAVMAGSMALTAARVVAGWVVMGTQSLIRGAQMAAAWVMAMGPVGWIIAAVVGLVALIVANWDTVVAWTRQAWDWVVGAVKGAAEWIWNLFLNWTLPGLIIKHWDTIVGAVRAAVNWVIDAVSWLGQLPGRVGAWFRGVYDGAVSKLGELVSWLTGLPGRVLSGIGDFGSLLLNAGKDLLSGLWRGIQNAAGWLKDKILSFFGSLIPDWVKDVLGIHSPSRVFAEIGRWLPPGLAVGIEDNAGVALSAVGGLASAMAGEMAGADLGKPAVSALIGSGTGHTYGAQGGTGSGTARLGGPDSPGPGNTTVNVYANTNADPHAIGAEVAWAVRTTGR